MVQDVTKYVDDGKGSFNYVHQTDVWLIMERAWKEGNASLNNVVAQNSTSNNTESDVIALANKFLGLHKDPLTKTVMPLFIKWVQQTHIS